MKNRIFLTITVALLSLNACSSDHSREYRDDYGTLTEYYLQTYDPAEDRFYGVTHIYYECGNEIVGHTDINGMFRLHKDDQCTFFDLNDRVSIEYDRLYISADRAGNYAVTQSPYHCVSGWEGVMNAKGMFVFDPEYLSARSKGDICSLDF